MSPSPTSSPRPRHFEPSQSRLGDTGKKTSRGITLSSNGAKKHLGGRLTSDPVAVATKQELIWSEFQPIPPIRTPRKQPKVIQHNIRNATTTFANALSQFPNGTNPTHQYRVKGRHQITNRRSNETNKQIVDLLPPPIRESGGPEVQPGPQKSRRRKGLSCRLSICALPFNSDQKKTFLIEQSAELVCWLDDGVRGL